MNSVVTEETNLNAPLHLSALIITTREEHVLRMRLWFKGSVLAHVETSLTSHASEVSEVVCFNIFVCHRKP